ncbi:hypothetical protein ES319_D06G211800v1 [Gossypium barbadense]|uniref:Uncharacterized protein n=2 Tax=Gossypium TaxID=3633 RepID=A0A5J5RC33_GOSBA|nr:hypothetical protein ES319_D06G211800v1 [Gossypium barbadense]
MVSTISFWLGLEFGFDPLNGKNGENPDGKGPLGGTQTNGGPSNGFGNIGTKMCFAQMKSTKKFIWSKEFTKDLIFHSYFFDERMLKFYM